MEELAHIAPFPVRLDDAALEPIHVEQIIDDAVQAMRSVVDFAGQFLEHLRVLAIRRQAQEFLAGCADRSERRFARRKKRSLRRSERQGRK